jgi:hypothetical protein
VNWIKESMPRASDQAVLATAQTEDRLVLTHDKDFGELAFRSNLPATCGVLLIRLAGDNPQDDADRVLRAIDGRNDWTGHFSVLDRGRLRMRPLPSTQSQRKPK